MTEPRFIYTDDAAQICYHVWEGKRDRPCESRSPYRRKASLAQHMLGALGGKTIQATLTHVMPRAELDPNKSAFYGLYAVAHFNIELILPAESSYALEHFYRGRYLQSNTSPNRMLSYTSAWLSRRDWGSWREYRYLPITIPLLWWAAVAAADEYNLIACPANYDLQGRYRPPGRNWRTELYDLVTKQVRQANDLYTAPPPPRPMRRILW